MVHELEVRLFADRIGTLALVEGRLTFRYAADWLKQPNAAALSCSLPLQAEPFDDHRARPFFAGLLPEGNMRRLIAQQFQVSGQNDFALLDHIGGECAGAVTFLEPGQPLRLPATGSEVEWLSDGEVIAILDWMNCPVVQCWPAKMTCAYRWPVPRTNSRWSWMAIGSACPTTARPVRTSSSRRFATWKTASRMKVSASRWPRRCNSNLHVQEFTRSVIDSFSWSNATTEPPLRSPRRMG